MANRTLTEHAEAGNPNGWRSTARIERLSSGAPGIIVVIDTYLNDEQVESNCVLIPDGAAFLAPVFGWLAGSPETERRAAYHRLSEHFAAHVDVALADMNEERALGATALMEDVNLLSHGERNAV